MSSVEQFTDGAMRKVAASPKFFGTYIRAQYQEQQPNFIW